MVSKSIIEMAREAGFAFEEQDNLFVVDPDGVCKFAELVRADEREACAKVCDDEWDGDADTYEYSMAANSLAKAIRARGNT